MPTEPRYISLRERFEILEKHDFKCKFCGVANLSTGYRDRDGQFIPVIPMRGTASDGAWMTDKPIMKIVLQIAQADEVTTLALCARCNARMRNGLDYEEVQVSPKELKEAKVKPDFGQISMF